MNKKVIISTTHGYGAAGREHIESTVFNVCSHLGSQYNDSNLNASMFILRTCAAETQFCTYPDQHALTNGVGAFQIDQIAFDDIKDRTRDRNKAIVLNAFGYKWDEIELKHLAFNLELSAIFCRLFLLLKPEPIPIASNLQMQAVYWKTHYNTSAGKGTIKHFIQSAKEHGLEGS